ncbi:MAG: hypothetical protein JXB26_19940 [Candidatus Aminicenantes bacterium]|nr:hypothetical protein [Candidatus Aminicenantes bacterium]
MNLLQNAVIVVISFLLSRIIIDSDTHHYFVHSFLRRSRPNISSLVSGILISSYFLSLFFTNTVVVLSMLPVVKMLLEGIADKSLKKYYTTHFILALIYGANIGGMGSLTGSSLNFVFVSFIEISKIPGRENITFFTWILIGVPATLILLFLARLILKPGEKKGLMDMALLDLSLKPEPSAHKKYTIFFAGNILLLFLLTFLQFFFRPPNIWSHFNIIDLSLFCYLMIFLFFVFIFPRRKKNAAAAFDNLIFFLFFLVFFPLIFINESWKEIRLRFHMTSGKKKTGLDVFIQKTFNRFWNIPFQKGWTDLKRKNVNVFVSANKLIYDLPFFGLVFMGFVVVIAYGIIKLGDNPATAGIDGYVVGLLKKASSLLTPYQQDGFLFLLVVVFLSIFLTELINNTTVILITFPLILTMAAGSNANPLISLFAVTIASSGAFMTPIATSANAVGFASLPGVSLKKMMARGLILNLAGGIWITLFFLFLGYL